MHGGQRLPLAAQRRSQYLCRPTTAAGVTLVGFAGGLPPCPEPSTPPIPRRASPLPSCPHPHNLMRAPGPRKCYWDGLGSPLRRLGLRIEKDCFFFSFFILYT